MNRRHTARRMGLAVDYERMEDFHRQVERWVGPIANEVGFDINDSYHDSGYEEGQARSLLMQPTGSSWKRPLRLGRLPRDRPIVVERYSVLYEAEPSIARSFPHLFHHDVEAGPEESVELWVKYYRESDSLSAAVDALDLAMWAAGSDIAPWLSEMTNRSSSMESRVKATAEGLQQLFDAHR